VPRWVLPSMLFCYQSRGNAIQCARLLLKTLLFVSSVVVFVGSFKDGEGEGDP
jgi:hypothetical protein